VFSGPRENSQLILYSQVVVAMRATTEKFPNESDIVKKWQADVAKAKETVLRLSTAAKSMPGSAPGSVSLVHTLNTAPSHNALSLRHSEPNLLMLRALLEVQVCSQPS
jgi:hypothetical protein